MFFHTRKSRGACTHIRHNPKVEYEFVYFFGRTLCGFHVKELDLGVSPLFLFLRTDTVVPAVPTRVRFTYLGNRKLPKKSTEVTKRVNYPGFHFQFARITLLLG